MKLVTCELIDDKVYICENSSGGDFWILAGFLTSDVGGGASSYREFINNPNQIETSSNYTMMEKEGDELLLACQFDYDFEPCIKMSQKEMLSILDQWQELVKLRPQEIIIFKRDDSYILEGRNAPSKE
ncbi:MAG TPA: hypothetical protein VGT41_04400 [Candidatus Babeliales bacterium]|nr:hypothetical protein [Candidatus Babeliales bacterium]